MANSSDDTMSRLDRVETAIAHLTDVVVLQSERLDGLTRTVDNLSRTVGKMSERIDKVSDRLDTVTDRLDTMNERIDTMNERIDRLVAVTIKERTTGSERLANIELRLARLEEHTGLTSS